MMMMMMQDVFLLLFLSFFLSLPLFCFSSFLPVPFCAILVPGKKYSKAGIKKNIW